MPFVQEVFATAEVVRRKQPDASCAIELGGEDAKIIFFTGGLDQRMNGNCARRHGRVYRPDGRAAGRNREPSWTALSLNASQHLPHRLPLRRVRQERHSAAAKPGCAQGGHRGQHISGSRKPDHCGPCAGAAHSTARCCSWAGRCTSAKDCAQRFCETLKLDEKHAIFPEYGRLSPSRWARRMYAEKNGGGLSFDALTERYDKTRLPSRRRGRLKAAV